MGRHLLKIGLIAWTACLTNDISAGSATNALNVVANGFADASQKLKLSIVWGICSYPTNALFAIVKPQRNRQLRDFYKLANSRLPMFSWFGLDSFCPILIGVDGGGCRKTEVAFLYKSMRMALSDEAWRPLGGWERTCNYSNSFYDGVMKVLFMEQVTSPISDRFDAKTEIIFEGKRLCPTFETALVDFGIDKTKFDEVFANDVYMRCSCGPFDICEETARRIIAHDANEMLPCASKMIGKSVDRVTLNGREISEVVYWLWNRKGKRGEYAGFVREHPELFEPIADVSEFKTELGKRLLGTWE